MPSSFFSLQPCLFVYLVLLKNPPTFLALQTPSKYPRTLERDLDLLRDEVSSPPSFPWIRRARLNALKIENTGGHGPSRLIHVTVYSECGGFFFRK